MIVGTRGWVPSPGCGIPGYGTDEAYVYLGGPNGLSKTPVATLQGPKPNQSCGCDCDFFGTSVAAAGDVNGDGYGDVLVGDYAAAEGPSSGKTWIFYGTATGVSTTGTSFSAGTDAGFGISGVGDVNADGFADVAVGSTQQGSPSGVFMGSASGLVLTPVSISYTGWKMPMKPVGVGDLNGDGYADLAQMSTGENAGQPYFILFPGSATGTTTNGTIVSATSGFTDPLFTSGDMNGDGFDDFVVWSA
jgi:hypothetical protein